MSARHHASRSDIIEASIKLMKTKERQEVHLAGMLRMTLSWAILAGLVYWLFPGGFPIKQNLFWTGKPVTEILGTVWPLFAWGFGMALLLSMLIKRSHADRLVASHVHKINMGISVQAGVLEELTFRFFAFIAMIGTIPITNWILFGWNGGGLLQWFYTVIMVPVTNWLTLGHMTDLLATTPWFVGAALLSANALFRDGHKYQGAFGLVNSWYIGMFLFWIMFEYGLIAAIVIHILYDVIVFSVEHLDVIVFDNR